MHDQTHKRNLKDLAAPLAGMLLVAALSGCASSPQDRGGPAKRAVDLIATTAVQSLSDSNVRNAWQDGSGMWHWVKVKPGVGTFQCEGPRLGVPTQCDLISAP